MSFSHIVFIAQMLQTPGLMALSITATRMYRSLADFTNPEYYASRSPRSVYANRSRRPRSFDSYLSRTGHTEIAHPIPISSAPAAVSRVEVAVHTFSEGYLSAIKGQCAS